MLNPYSDISYIGQERFSLNNIGIRFECYYYCLDKLPPFDLFILPIVRALYPTLDVIIDEFSSSQNLN